MENRPSVRKGTTTNKYSIPKKISKPVKVVYISNPMMVKTSVSEFRSLVQELTGRDSDISSRSFDRSRFTDSNEIDNCQTVPHDDHRSENMKVNLARTNTNDNINHQQQQQYGDFTEEVLGFDYPSWMSTSSDSSSSIFEPLDDVFVPRVMESMNGVFPLTPLMEVQPTFGRF
ncbi:hypothetical protein C5167_001853 [Papaver somniferum]|uniref:VQ domain-containing protein n=1 Tax=Papaver somniferum TaxID=3469 RepID=A0A4Y7KWF7_PAPSO|nr:VQ motif-containing protein 18-like [Papaver somniferum]RZC77664.1 hypothetical protein C5167_001853 [Papaver somniferum]